MQVQNWDRCEPMTEAAIRATHIPPDHFRISKSEFEMNTCFSGSTRTGRCYVLEGSCIYRFEKNEVEIRAGQFADLVGGRYNFEVLGDTGVSIIKVWNLSEFFKKHNQNSGHP